ncbi:FAD-dependent oxidoreductase [Rhizobium laguerreae]|nr:FAD-dependent oxidoreductase [Rhizobium laguerreae]
MAEPFAMPRGWRTLLTFALGKSNDVKWSARGLLKLAPHLVLYFQNSSKARHAQISNVNAQLALHATHDHAPLIQASGSGNLISQDGFCEVYRDGRAFEAASKDTERLMSTYGVRARILDGEAFRAEEPAFLTTPAGAVHWQNCWSCNDPGGLTAAYSQLFSKRGGSILIGDANTLEESPRGWQIAATSHSITAEHVVIALGPWSAQFLDPNAGPRPDHAASTARMSCVRAVVSTELPKRSVRPQLNRSSTTPEDISRSSAAFICTAFTSTGMNNAFDDAERSPFFFSSLRQA